MPRNAVATHLLQYGDDGRPALLQVVNDHEDVGVRGEASSRRIADVTHLGHTEGTPI